MDYRNHCEILMKKYYNHQVFMETMPKFEDCSVDDYLLKDVASIVKDYYQLVTISVDNPFYIGLHKGLWNDVTYSFRVSNNRYHDLHISVRDSSDFKDGVGYVAQRMSYNKESNTFLGYVLIHYYNQNCFMYDQHIFHNNSTRRYKCTDGILTSRNI